MPRAAESNPAGVMLGAARLTRDVDPRPSAGVLTLRGRRPATVLEADLHGVALAELPRRVAAMVNAVQGCARTEGLAVAPHSTAARYATGRAALEDGDYAALVGLAKAAVGHPANANPFEAGPVQASDYVPAEERSARWMPFAAERYAHGAWARDVGGDLVRSQSWLCVFHALLYDAIARADGPAVLLLQLLLPLRLQRSARTMAALLALGNRYDPLLCDAVTRYGGWGLGTALAAAAPAAPRGAALALRHAVFVLPRNGFGETKAFACRSLQGCALEFLLSHNAPLFAAALRVMRPEHPEEDALLWEKVAPRLEAADPSVDETVLEDCLRALANHVPHSWAVALAIMGAHGLLEQVSCQGAALDLLTYAQGRERDRAEAARSGAARSNTATPERKRVRPPGPVDENRPGKRFETVTVFDSVSGLSPRSRRKLRPRWRGSPRAVAQAASEPGHT